MALKKADNKVKSRHKRKRRLILLGGISILTIVFTTYTTGKYWVEIYAKHQENKILERVGVFLGILLGYLFVPQVIGYYIFKSFHVDSIVAGLIGTAFFALIILIVLGSL